MNTIEQWSSIDKRDDFRTVFIHGRQCFVNEIIWKSVCHLFLRRSSSRHRIDCTEQDVVSIARRSSQSDVDRVTLKWTVDELDDHCQLNKQLPLDSSDWLVSIEQYVRVATICTFRCLGNASLLFTNIAIGIEIIDRCRGALGGWKQVIKGRRRVHIQFSGSTRGDGEPEYHGYPILLQSSAGTYDNHSFCPTMFSSSYSLGGPKQRTNHIRTQWGRSPDDHLECMYIRRRYGNHRQIVCAFFTHSPCRVGLWRDE